MNTININGVEYVPVEELDKTISAVDLNGMPYQIVRTYNAGVFAGYVEKRDGKEVTMHVKTGDVVIFSKYAGNEVKLDDEEYIIVKQSDILAIVE